VDWNRLLQWVAARVIIAIEDTGFT